MFCRDLRTNSVCFPKPFSFTDTKSVYCAVLITDTESVYCAVLITDTESVYCAVLITDTESVYCAVRTESLNIYQVDLNF